MGSGNAKVDIISYYFLCDEVWVGNATRDNLKFNEVLVDKQSTSLDLVSTARVQILNEVVCILHRANNSAIGINSSTLIPAVRK